ncbi:NADH-quinone oxidoreductase subunit M [Gallionella capsiferriformans]|jgi:NADH-quinone oxidoreductase subunit M|uniref:Proton-translocating NADH-quinone oxidoreductase, chain M n=1 Tax=Gallionella capsiferriformans (strain ES-2) TaxID=395494 RepID=D9SI39_GALCS|nr:NADH-quinone oxidoreductase subunit M [Gallionella capsiferriformans]ADL56129.1 proton-translocating NADH-quinone oxidoreductase, chain M [Gallionella capsiferriformans ES-2]
MIFGLPVISVTIWLPILFGILVLATGDDKNAPLARLLALVGSVLGCLVTIPLYTGFDISTSNMQFVELHDWITRFNIHYHLGVDGISMLFILLNSFFTVIVVLAGWKVIEKRVAMYMAAFLVMSGIVNGVFAALDSILFYVFWEAMLIPMFIIIGIWGGPNRIYATMKFFLYTLLGSLLMLVALIYLYNLSGGSFAILDFHHLAIPMTAQILIFIAFFFAFAVKVPMFPVHTWLPDAHVEAPTGGSVVLAAIMLKVGAYGFLRFSMPITPDASHKLAGVMIALSLIAIVYIGLVALMQSDMKKLVAYSSISHMGFVTLGLFIFNAYGMEGALLQMLSHGFVAGALFLCIGVLYDRVHSRQIADYGGVVNKMPVFAAFFMLFAMANSGLPGTSAFVGEFMVIMGTIKVNFWYAFAAASTLIFGAAYTLWMYKRVIFGAVTNHHVEELTDINAREILIMTILAFFVLAMGIYPLPVSEILHASVNDLLLHVAHSKLPI